NAAPQTPKAAIQVERFMVSPSVVLPMATQATTVAPSATTGDALGSDLFAAPVAAWRAAR
ncbi:MAG TPA: hypothetical protein VIY30_11595, partial [Burkholderiaceae bacterium]